MRNRCSAKLPLLSGKYCIKVYKTHNPVAT